MARLAESMSHQPTRVLNTDATNKAEDADAARQEIGADIVAYGDFTTTVTVWDEDAAVADDKLTLVMQAGLTKDAEFANVPNVLDEAKTPEQRSALEFLFGQLELDRALAAPPDLPAERLATLRAAFDAMTGDGEFLDEVRALKLDVRPLKGEETTAVIRRLFATPRLAIERVRAALTGKSEP